MIIQIHILIIKSLNVTTLIIDSNFNFCRYNYVKAKNDSMKSNQSDYRIKEKHSINNRVASTKC